LYVLNEGDLHEAVVGIVLDDNGNLCKTGEFGRPPTAFTSDELITRTSEADDEGLDNAMLADGLGELLESVGLEDGTRLEGIGIDVANRYP
jgi:hypothetical protein